MAKSVAREYYEALSERVLQTAPDRTGIPTVFSGVIIGPDSSKGETGPRFCTKRREVRFVLSHMTTNVPDQSEVHYDAVRNTVIGSTLLRSLRDSILPAENTRPLVFSVDAEHYFGEWPRQGKVERVSSLEVFYRKPPNISANTVYGDRNSTRMIQGLLPFVRDRNHRVELTSSTSV